MDLTFCSAVLIKLWSSYCCKVLNNKLALFTKALALAKSSNPAPLVGAAVVYILAFVISNSNCAANRVLTALFTAF